MPEWINLGALVVGQVFTAGAIYGAIKGDIKALVAGVGEAKQTAKEAHLRLDNHFERHNHGKA